MDLPDAKNALFFEIVYPEFRPTEPKGKQRWMISRGYLEAEFGKPDSSTSESGAGDTLELLRSSIETLTKQLDVKDEQISELTERQKEQNVLLQGLQNKLPQLTAGTGEAEPVKQPVVDVVQEAKSGWLQKMFRRREESVSNSVA